MRHDFLDRYSRIDSPIHRLPATVKLLGTLCIISVTVAVNFSHGWVFGFIGAALLVISALTTIPWRFVLGRLIMLEPFALGIAVMALFQEHGTWIFLSIVTKSSLCLLTVILLSNTTPFSELLVTLKRFRVPTLFVTILALMYRYLFVLIDEAERLTRARNSRTFSDKRLRKWGSMASLVGQLFVRSTERAERIYAAMSARGWK
ncbi:MAG: cobalt ECF transporter T component CbiQ [Ignavibacteriales bacterium]|nr:cobalt ECF transporter T component CbiQ [Ignavibacteriales bacterium]